MRKYPLIAALIAVLAIAGFTAREAVFAQDATPVGDNTPISEPTSVTGDGSAATPATTGPNIVTLVFIEHATSDTLIDLGDSGASIGDQLAFANDVFDEANENQAGTDQGSCVLTVPDQAYECSWTLTLTDGQIMVQGPFLENADSVLAVTGGTGAYVGVSGQLRVHVISDTENRFTYELQ